MYPRPNSGLARFAFLHAWFMLLNPCATFMKSTAVKLLVRITAMPLSLPEYSGGFLAFGVGPALTLAGLGWSFSAFRRIEVTDRA